VTTGYCGFCGTAYDLIGGHTCTPTIMASGTAVAQHTSTPQCDGGHAPGPCPTGHGITTGYCTCGTIYDPTIGHTCPPPTSAAPNLAAEARVELSDADIDRIAKQVKATFELSNADIEEITARVERRLAERELLRGV
jgi:hypothetical protein